MFSYSSLVSIIQTILVLILVIILANLSLKLLNRKMSQNSRMIRIVERINVSNNSALAIAEICGKYYLMSFTDKANTILRELDKDEVENYLDDYEGHNSFSDMKDKAHLFLGNEEKRLNKKLILVLYIITITLIIIPNISYAEGGPGLTDILLNQEENPQYTVDSVRLLILLTVLSLAPSFLILTTCFTRIVVVFSFLRSGMGTQQSPPNQVIIGLALFITFFVMQPVFTEINDEAIQPFLENEINQEEAFDKAARPLKEFMLNQTREKDIALFLRASGSDNVEDPMDLSLTTVIPAFAISELRTAFSIGFIIYIPFLVLDMVVASILMSMGMFMLPPVMISLPFKILLFVLVDGWYLVVESLIESFI